MAKSIEKKNEKSREVSIKEGSAASVMSGAGDSYIVPYALALNASNFQVGFLSSFVGLFSAFSQLVGGELVYKFKKKNLVMLGVFFQVLAWISISMLGFLYWKGIIQSKVIILLIIFYCTASISGALAGPAWFSWMGEIVPQKIRGSYFSKRNKIAGFVAVITTLLASFWLDYMESLGLIVIAFSSLAMIAAVGRFISWLYFAKMHEEYEKPKKDSYFSILEFVKKAPSNNYGRFAIYVGLINLMTNVAGPFFTVYMLNELHLSYIWYILIILSATMFNAIMMPVWGKFGDEYGNRNLLKIGAILVTITPLLWLLTDNPLMLILVAQLCSGIGWSAFNLASSNFIYDAVTPQRRAICVAYYTVFNGLGIFLGALLGGYIADHVAPSFMSVFLLLFLISGIGRGIVSLIFIPLIREVRDIPKNKGRISLFQYAYLITPRPLFSIVRGVRVAVDGLFNINKKGKT